MLVSTFIAAAGWSSWQHMYGVDTANLPDHYIRTAHGFVSSEHTDARAQLNCQRNCEQDSTCHGFVYNDLQCFYRGGANVDANSLLAARKTAEHHNLWLLTRMPDPPLPPRPPPSRSPPPPRPPPSPPMPPPAPPSSPGLATLLPLLIASLVQQDASLASMWIGLLSLCLVSGFVCGLLSWVYSQLFAWLCSSCKTRFGEHTPPRRHVAESPSRESDGARSSRRSVSFSLSKSDRKLRSANRSMSFSRSKPARHAESACARGSSPSTDDVACRLNFADPALALRAGEPPRWAPPSRRYVNAMRAQIKRSRSASELRELV